MQIASYILIDIGSDLLYDRHLAGLHLLHIGHVEQVDLEVQRLWDIDKPAELFAALVQNHVLWFI